MSSILIRDNDAVYINPPASTINIHLTEHGSDWYWAAFSLIAVSTLGYVVSAAFVPRRERIFHYFAIGAGMFASIAYFTMASDLGSAGVSTEFSHYQGGGVRQVFYARYIGWFMVSPLILANVFMFSGVAWPTILMSLAAQEIYVVAFLVAAVVSSSYKWGFFTFGICAWWLVIYHLIFVAFPSAKKQSSDIKKHVLIMISGISFIWMLYPISFGLSEGGNVISPDSEAAFYGVLDMISLPIFCSYFIFVSRKTSVERLGLAFDHGFKPAIGSLPMSEKQAALEAGQARSEPERHSGETAVAQDESPAHSEVDPVNIPAEQVV
ncbi:uncharacterized protein V1516DRAFT_632159 [Lipomyces oligophaga]|uniref:uncharacterized protein n=1 Tax=Lipomyces oligophaga TaxID=45792 RepID=UPI0034CECEB5